MDKSKINPQSNKIKILVNTTVGTAKWLLPGEGRVQRRVLWQWLRSHRFILTCPPSRGAQNCPADRLPFSLFDSCERPEDSTGGVISDFAGCCHWASPGEAPPVCVRPHHSYLNSLGRLHLLRDKKIMTVSAGASLLERI